MTTREKADRLAELVRELAKDKAATTCKDCGAYRTDPCPNARSANHGIGPVGNDPLCDRGKEALAYGIKQYEQEIKTLELELLEPPLGFIRVDSVEWSARDGLSGRKTRALIPIQNIRDVVEALGDAKPGKIQYGAPGLASLVVYVSNTFDEIEVRIKIAQELMAKASSGKAAP